MHAEKKFAFIISLILLSIPMIGHCAEVPDIVVNSIGFYPNDQKQAVVIGRHGGEEFKVINATNGKTVFTGKLSDAQWREDVKQDLCIADFSAFKKSGRYKIVANNGKESCEFNIGKTVYKDAYTTAMRAFYLWRCGMAVETTYNGHHYQTTAACHTKDGYTKYLGEEQDWRDGTGGWHDAGDFGKYTVNAGVTVGVLFMAWQHFQKQLNSVDLNLPETAKGFPEFLKEIKWETDFLLKMQYADGSGRVSHKLTRTEFSGFIMPETDDGKRYFTEWSSAATADFAAMMAMASRIFEPYDKEYSERILSAARLSYDALKKYGRKNFMQGDFSTGGYQTGDDDDIVWAAVEMWEATGEQQYLTDAEQRLGSQWNLIDSNWDWGDVSNLGAYTYILSKREGKNAELENKLKAAVIKDANQLADNSLSDPFGRALNQYYWGCNGTVCRQALNLHMADILAPNAKYQTAIKRIAGYVLGNNIYGRSFVTGIGVNPPMHPHDRRSGADGIDDPWPGYIVGGGHSATDWVDEQDDYSRNEIAINWQAGLVYLLSAALAE